MPFGEAAGGATGGGRAPAADPGALPFVPFLDPNEISPADQAFWRSFAQTSPEQAEAVARATGGDYGALRSAVAQLRRGVPGSAVAEDIGRGILRVPGEEPGPGGARQNFLQASGPWRPGSTHVSADGQSYILPDGRSGRIPFNVNDFYNATKSDELRNLTAAERYGATLPQGLLESRSVTLLDAMLAQMVCASRTPLEGRAPNALLAPEAFIARYGDGGPRFEEELRRQVASAIHDQHFSLGIPPSHFEQSGYARWTIHAAGELDTRNPEQLAQVYATELDAAFSRFFSQDIPQGRMPEIDSFKRMGFLHHPGTRDLVWSSVARYNAAETAGERREVLEELGERLATVISEVANPESLFEEAVLMNAYLDLTGLRAARQAALDPASGTPRERIARFLDALNRPMPTREELQREMREVEGSLDRGRFEQSFRNSVDAVYRRYLDPSSGSLP